MAAATQNGTQAKPMGVLDKLLGNDGIKTDVRIVIGDDTYYKLTASLVAAFVICMILNLILKSVSKGV